MEEYSSNSNKSKAPAEPIVEKNITKVIKSTAKTKKKHLFSGFFQGDGQNVASYIGNDVILPSLKKAISDVVTNGIDILLYGEKKNHSQNGYKPSYARFYDEKKESSVVNYVPRKGYTFEEVVLDNRADAEELLEEMRNVIREYHAVSVNDMYDMVGIPAKFTDTKYGWTDISEARIERDIHGNYVVKMPAATAL